MSKVGDIRPHLEALLDALDHAPLSLPRDNSADDALVRVPVVFRGKINNYHTEPAGDYRIEAERAHHNRILELRRALGDGDDPYRIAWLALSVGAGTALPATMQAAFTHREAVKRGKKKAGKTKATREQKDRFLAALKATKGPSFHERVKRAKNKSGWPFSVSTGERLGIKAGLSKAE